MYGPSTMPSLLSETAMIEYNLPGRIVRVAPRRHFREPFEPADEFILVRQGLLGLYCTNEAGGKQIVSLRYSGEEVMASEFPPAYGLVALAPCELLVASKGDFEECLGRSSPFLQLLRRRADRHASISYEWLLNNGRRDTISRVAHLLCETAVRTDADKAGYGLWLPFSQQTIADITGQTAVNVNYVLNRLEALSLIKREGRRIEFLNWRELQCLAGFRPDYLQ